METAIFSVVLILTVITAIVFTVVKSHKRQLESVRNAFGSIRNPDDIDLDSIEEYHKLKRLHTDNKRLVDATTWNDLEMDKVYRRIDHCDTSVGEEYLYDVLHTPEYDIKKLIRREKLITYFENNPSEREKVEVILSKTGRVGENGLPRLLFEDTPLWHNNVIYKILPFFPLCCALVIPLSIGIGIAMTVLAFIVNLVIYYLNSSKTEGILGTIKYFSALLSACSKLVSCDFKGLDSYNKKLCENFTVFRRIMGKLAFAYNRTGSQSDVFTEYYKIFTLYNLRTYNKSVSVINSNREKLNALYETIGEIDIAISILSFRESLDFYCLPEFSEDKGIKTEGIYHVMLSRPVLNDADISDNSVITGSNASGKSTFIKSLAVNGILAQTIFTCTANRFVTKMALVVTSMAVRDNLTEGESYFITEIKSLKRIIEKSESTYCCCYIDEILKGTNTIERIAASAAVLEHISHGESLCVVASHDIELTQILKDCYLNFNFCEHITDDGIEFDYKLKDGPSKTRNAIKLLDYMKLDSEIVMRAQKRVDAFESTHKWE